MPQASERPRIASAAKGGLDATGKTTTPLTDRGIDPVKEPDGFAKTVLHHAITHGDRLGEDANGNVVVLLALSRQACDQLAQFDPDGDPDIESR